MHDRPEAARAPVELTRSFIGRPGKISVIDHLATNERGRATNGAFDRTYTPRSTLVDEGFDQPD
jgi:hypothetical protein